MSDDLINKKEASTLLRKRSQQLVGIYGDLGGALSGAARLIDELPAADRPQGKWIEIGTISHSYKCSVCGRTLFHITVGKNHVAKYYPYCHCGARMKGADDEA